MGTYQQTELSHIFIGLVAAQGLLSRYAKRSATLKDAYRFLTLASDAIALAESEIANKTRGSQLRLPLVYTEKEGFAGVNQ